LGLSCDDDQLIILLQERTLEILEQAGPQKHVMNLGHGIEAVTPEENAKFFIDTVKAYRYKK